MPSDEPKKSPKNNLNVFLSSLGKVTSTMTDLKPPKYEPCVRPLEITRTTTYLASGKSSVSVFDKRCGTRRADKCEPCSFVWRDDAYHALMNPSKEHQGTVTFITLTAPGSEFFGKTHTAQYAGLMSERCSCRSFHKPEDEIVGLPIKSAKGKEFEYRKVVEFNQKSSRLVTVTLQKIYRQLGQLNGKSEKEVRLPTARVMEWQSRGVLHAHILVRGNIPTFIVENAVNGSPKNKHRRRIDPANHAGMRWGSQVNVRHINSGDEKQLGRLGGYMTKVVGYALKDVNSQDAIKNLERKKFTRKLRSYTNEVIRCNKPWSICSASPTATNEQRMSDLTRTNKPYCVKHRRAFHQIGFTGNVLTLNRIWGSSLKQSREARIAFMKSQFSGVRDAVKASRLDTEKKAITVVVKKKDLTKIFQTLDKKYSRRTVLNEGLSTPIRT